MYKGPKFLYLCVDEDGTECCFCDVRPKRSQKIGDDKRYWYSHWEKEFVLPKGAIKAMTGIDATWETKPIKWKPTIPCNHDWKLIANTIEEKCSRCKAIRIAN